MADNKYSSIMIDGDGETVRLELRPAWRSLWKWYAIVAMIVIFSAEADLTSAGITLSFIILSLGIIIRYRKLYTVTSKRVIFRDGLIARNTKEVEIRHTRELQVRQGIVERILNYGTVEVSTAAGIGPAVIFSAILYPQDLKEAIRHVRNGL